MYQYKQVQVLKPHTCKANEDHEEIAIAQEFHVGRNG
jgi:hypothetical protein